MYKESFVFIILTKNTEVQVLVDPEDREKVEAINWGIYKDPKGRPLARAGKKDGQVLLHKLLFDIPKGVRLEWKNRNTLDLRRSNLQLVHKDGTIEQLEKPKQEEEPQPKHEAVQNERGVYFHKASNRWHASAFFGGKRYSLGYFTDKQDAVNEIQTFRREGPTSEKLKRNKGKMKHDSG